MRLALILLVLIGATSGICPDQWVGSGSGESTIQTFLEDTECSGDDGVDGLRMSESEWAADMGSECTPQHGECFPWSTACDNKLADLCIRSSGYTSDGQTVKSLIVWWAEQGGRPESGCGETCTKWVIGASVFVNSVFIIWLVYMWLSGGLNKSSCGEPPCPSPLNLESPTDENVDGGKSSAVQLSDFGGSKEKNETEYEGIEAGNDD